MNGYGLLKKRVFFRKTLGQFSAAVRVDVVSIGINRQSVYFEIFRNIGSGIDNVHIGIFFCQFFDAFISF